MLKLGCSIQTSVEISEEYMNKKNFKVQKKQEHNQGAQNKKFKKAGLCHFCKKLGHQKKECFKFKAFLDKKTGNGGKFL